MGSFEENIDRLVALSDELKDLVAQAHGALKDLRTERREIEKLMSTDVKRLIQERVDVVIEKELAELGPGIREQTNLIYGRVGDQIDKLIGLSLGKEFKVGKYGDLRPMLAERLRILIQEIITEVDHGDG